jgi:hypothetical protein
MRLFAIAALAGLTLAAATGVAAARTFNDPAGRVTFDYPDGWSVMDQGVANMTYVIAGTANNECHVLAIPREQSAALSVDQIRNASGNDANYTPEAWARIAGGIGGVFRAAPTVVSHSEETNQFWPLQRAELQGERLVHGAIQLRPGMEIHTYCQTYEGADDTIAYDALIRSVKTPNDAALEAQATPAAPAAPAAPPAQ